MSQATNWASVAQNIDNQVTSVVTSLAKGLGVGAQYVLQIELRQAVVVGIENAIWAIALAIALFPLYRILKKAYRGVMSNSSVDIELFPAWIILSIFGTIGFIIMCLFIVMDIGHAIGDIVNPGHYVIQQITNLIGNMTGHNSN